MKKKILSMLLSMVLTVACFTGCGSNPSSGGETGGAASTETPKNPEDMYTVTMAVIGNDQEDMDLVEANEAFAAQSLAVAHDLGLDMEKTNVNGGAIALGHPIGASGARILVTLLYEMAKRDSKYGLATLCIGGGQGQALIVKR